MFFVRFTAEAKALVAERSAREGYLKPGVMIHRQGPRGDVTRSADGQAQWNIEHPHPWRAQVGDFQTFGENAEDVYLVDGINIWLALTPRLGEIGVEISVRDADLVVEAVDD